MQAYSEAYLGDVVENQGKLFDFVAHNYPDKDTADFYSGLYEQQNQKKHR